MIPWLAAGAAFPPVSTALRHPNGLLAAGGEISAALLIQAYRRGIFPWYSADEPVLWWSPDPRMVLPTDGFRISRSVRKHLQHVVRGHGWQVWLDRAFDVVMRACAEPRPEQDGTWITPTVLAAYGDLHRQGIAHSVEVWQDDRLIGGLYGVALGRMFFGESMFTRATDASKTALAALVQLLRIAQVPVIDCQQNTSHLASLGGREIPRDAFCALVARQVQAPEIDWSAWRRTPLDPLLHDLLSTR